MNLLMFVPLLMFILLSGYLGTSYIFCVGANGAIQRALCAATEGAMVPPLRNRNAVFHGVSKILPTGPLHGRSIGTVS